MNAGQIEELLPVWLERLRQPDSAQPRKRKARKIAVTVESKPLAPRDFLAKYHADLICALPEGEVEKLRIRLGANLLQPFVESLDGQVLTPEELKPRLERYLRDELQMADHAEVQVQGNLLSVEIKGCHLCYGNDLLRARGRDGCCPFAPGINRAVSKALHAGSRLEGVAKTPGKTGECVMRYTVEV